MRARHDFAPPRPRRSATPPLDTGTELEVRFIVPQAARAAIADEIARGTTTFERRTLAAIYLDTEDRRLARAGIAWRLRREGRRWIQTAKATGSTALERLEHEVIRPDATPDATGHAGTAVGERLLPVLAAAHAKGLEVEVRFQTRIRRDVRRIRTRGAMVEVSFDEGRLIAAEASQRVREIEFELVSGSASAMLTLAERWRKRFGLILEPRSKSERGDRLAEGAAHPPVRKGRPPEYPRQATVIAAFGAVVDECLEQINRNAIGLIDGDRALQVDHVHQMRVGIRRLRSALRSFDGWVPAPPPRLIEELRELFGRLGEARDGAVLDSGVVATLAKVGAPPLKVAAPVAGPDPVAIVRADATQRLLLGWIAWRTGLTQPAPLAKQVAKIAPAAKASAFTTPPLTPIPAAGAASVHDPIEASPPVADPASDARTDPTIQPATGTPPVEDDPNDIGAFHRNLERRLKRWHKRIVADWQVFDELDEEQLHELRKRIKRQRYAVEFFAPVLRRRSMDRYLEPLGAIQERMGELNDLVVARARYQTLVASDPAAWFALGWLAARIAALRALARPELEALASVEPPTH